MRYALPLRLPLVVWAAALTVLLLAAGRLNAEPILDLDESTAAWRFRGAAFEFTLTEPTLWQAYVIGDPHRLVLRWQGNAQGNAAALDIRAVAGPPVITSEAGWTRLELPLRRPMIIREAMLSDQILQLRLARARASTFATHSMTEAEPTSLDAPDTLLVPRGPVVIDPGHGGHDPGAVHDDLQEAMLTLDLGLRVADELARRNIPVLLTREDDRFLTLDQRVAIARGADAALFLSLHADSFGDSSVDGASVYTLSDLAAGANDGALFTEGLLPDGADSRLRDVLLTLAQSESSRRASQMRARILQAFDQTGLELNQSPVRSAGFRVLRAPDVPSVLIEFGYMSNPEDRSRLANPNWRARAAAALAQAIAEAYGS